MFYFFIALIILLQLCQIHLIEYLCIYKQCECESDYGFNYITCHFNSNTLDMNPKFKLVDKKLNLIDTLTIKIGKNESIDLKIFTDLSINILFMHETEIENLRPGFFDGIQSVKNIHLSNNKIEKLNFSIFDENFRQTVESIVLRNNSLYEIPEIIDLENLIYLDLSLNKIKVFKKLNTTECPLESLDISSNLIENLSTRDDFSKKIKETLNELILNSNKILKLEKFDNFTQLNKLGISYNKIKKLKSFTFQNLSTLNHLDLSHNQIELIENEAFKSLNNLALLDLSYNKIQIINKNIFMSLKNLEKLFLQSNRLKHVEFYVFNTLTILHVLDLSRNQIEEIGLEGANNFTNLNLLRLSQNKLEDIDYDGLFERIPNILMLYLENNYLIRIPTYFGNLIKLDMSSQNGRLTKLPNFAFKRFKTNVLLRFNLSDNVDLRFSNKTFCSRTNDTDLNYFMDLVMSPETLINTDKCVLKQLSYSHRRVRIFVEPEKIESYGIICDCKFRLFLAHYSILLKASCPRFKTYCSNVNFNDDCLTKNEFDCKY
ncbi:unnamed protein product [Brachionus calyciflorus]|uniref:Uncharacterized protein n=1 Tax=Brachionus calyciflorus TaxID=104777 RepID=A0A813M3N5_9BILA|nr:unnamed protein product [Brachionus calyciflorus]